MAFADATALSKREIFNDGYLGLRCIKEVIEGSEAE
jgi:hypothetical protein